MNRGDVGEVELGTAWTSERQGVANCSEGLETKAELIPLSRLLSPRSLPLQLTSRNNSSCYGGISILMVFDDLPVPAGHVELGLTPASGQAFEGRGKTPVTLNKQNKHVHARQYLSAYLSCIT